MISRPIVPLVVLAITAGLLQGCSTAQKQQSPWNAQSYEFSYLNKRVVPTDPVKLHRECAWLHSKMAEIEDFLQKSARITNPDWWNLAWQQEARQRSADLSSRYKQIQCQIRPVVQADAPSDSSTN